MPPSSRAQAVMSVILGCRYAMTEVYITHISRHFGRFFFHLLP